MNDLSCFTPSPRSLRARCMTGFALMIVLMMSSVISHAQTEPSYWSRLFTYLDPAAVRSYPRDITIMATGDVLLARTVNARMVETDDFTFPFQHVADFLSQADITWINLETPLVSDCPLRYSSLRFCGSPKTIAALLAAGVDVANLANNHAENHGQDGLLETISSLNAADIAVTGRPEAVIFEIKGQRIGFLGFNDASAVEWINGAEPDDVAAAISAVRDDVDYLLVGFHWGIEYRLMQNERQRALAVTAIDAGADVVIGHHPHWLQGVEVYRGKPILYSLGNFVFDQTFGGWVDEGAIAVITLQANGGVRVRFVPTIIEDRSTPRFANQAEAEKILRRIASVSRILKPSDLEP